MQRAASIGLVAESACLQQERFRNILAAGNLRDVWRQLHPGVQGGMTWRGGEWVCGPLRSSYAQKARHADVRFPQLNGLGMRLDHFVVSAALLSRVEACEAAAPPPEGPRREAAETRGPRLKHENHYFGSDHWPLWLRLRDAP